MGSEYRYQQHCRQQTDCLFWVQEFRLLLAEQLVPALLQLVSPPGPGPGPGPGPESLEQAQVLQVLEMEEHWRSNREQQSPSRQPEGAVPVPS